MKGWKVDLGDDISTGYVLAETRGRATMQVVREYINQSGEEWDRDYWKTLRTVRLPEIDGESFNVIQMVALGKMFVECDICAYGVKARNMVLQPFGKDSTGRGVDMVHICCSMECAEEAGTGATRYRELNSFEVFGAGQVLMLYSEW